MEKQFQVCYDEWTGTFWRRRVDGPMSEVMAQEHYRFIEQRGGHVRLVALHEIEHEDEVWP